MAPVRCSGRLADGSHVGVRTGPDAADVDRLRCGRRIDLGPDLHEDDLRGQQPTDTVDVRSDVGAVDGGRAVRNSNRRWQPVRDRWDLMLR